jgi:hypothetical protein
LQGENDGKKIQGSLEEKCSILILIASRGKIQANLHASYGKSCQGPAYHDALMAINQLGVYITKF